MRRKSSLHLALALALVLPAGCDDEPERPAARRPAASARTPDPASGKAAEPKVPGEPTSAWPAEVEDLADSLRGFTTTEACRKGLRQRMPTAVAEVIADIGYDALVDDVCAGLAAVKKGDVAGCDALTISALQKGCRRRLAVVHGRPGVCPDDPVVPGRDPLCLAWARRDPGLCRAAPIAERETCRAVLAGEAERCDESEGHDAERCAAKVRRYASAVGDERADTAAADLEPALTLAPLEDDEPVEERRIETDALARGVYLEPDGCAHRIMLADPMHDTPSFFDDEPFAKITIEVPAAAELPLALSVGPGGAAVEVRAPDTRGAGEGDAVAGNVTLEALSRDRGAELSGALSVRFDDGDGATTWEGTFRTFVRDVDPLPDRCAEQTPPAME